MSNTETRQVPMTVVFRDASPDYTFNLTIDHIEDQFGKLQAKARQIVNEGVVVKRDDGSNMFVSPRVILGVIWENVR